MAPTQPPLSHILPPLVCGTGTFNNLYNPTIASIPSNQIVASALHQGIRAFDTSPYYGPSETLLGTALSQPAVLKAHPRASYQILTKVGRIAGSEFDYSPAWIQYSVRRSLQRLRTSYLDVVYCHDVEFVSPLEVLTAIRELRYIRDTQGTIKYIGMSGYPVPLLADLAEMILRETGEPLDIVLSYANFTLQNTSLLQGLDRLRRAGVSVVPNASPLGMGLLRSKGVPVGGKGDFHPAPPELRQKVMEAVKFVESKGEKLEVVAIRWALEQWAIQAASLGGEGGLGVSVMGVSNLGELEETMKVWNSILDGFELRGRSVRREEKTWSLERRKEIEGLVEGIWKILGEWKDFTWPSPDVGYVNERVVKGVIEEEVPISGESKL